MDIEYISNEKFVILLDQTLKLTKERAAFIAYLKRSAIKGHKYKT